MDPQISPEAARILRLMIVSCGTVGCFESMKRLDAVTETTGLASIGLDELGNWRMSVFQRLQWYANDMGLKRFNVEDVVRYFGGTLHIDIMERIADHAGLGQYLGRDVGLITHSLLPLKGSTYSNEGHMVTFEDSIELNPHESGSRFYHLGGIINIPVAESVIQDILAKQASSDAFMRSLRKIDGQTVRLPREYRESLNCTAEKAQT